MRRATWMLVIAITIALELALGVFALVSQQGGGPAAPSATPTADETSFVFSPRPQVQSPQPETSPQPAQSPTLTQTPTPQTSPTVAATEPPIAMTGPAWLPSSLGLLPLLGAVLVAYSLRRTR